MIKASYLFASVAFALLTGCAASSSSEDATQTESAMVAPQPPTDLVGEFVTTSEWTPGSLVGLAMDDHFHYEATYRFATACAPADCDLVHEEGTFQINYVLPAGASRRLTLKSNTGNTHSYLVADGQDALVLLGSPNTVLHRARWGGRGISLDMRPYGASLSFDCAAGTFSSAIVTDAQGKFTALGTFTVGSGIPFPEGHQPPTYPATWRGQIQQGKMDLTLEIQGQTPQTYRLEEGDSGSLIHCL